jgi:hypothetical protein
MEEEKPGIGILLFTKELGSSVKNNSSVGQTVALIR